jgi:hypothetical protein
MSYSELSLPKYCTGIRLKCTGNYNWNAKDKIKKKSGLYKGKDEEWTKLVMIYLDRLRAYVC